MGWWSWNIEASESQKAIGRRDRATMNARAKEARNRAKARREEQEWERAHPNGRRRAK